MYTNGSGRWGDKGKERKDSLSSSDSDLDWNGYFGKGRAQARQESRDDSHSINSDPVPVANKVEDDLNVRNNAFSRLFAAVTRPRSDSMLSSATRSQISESDSGDDGIQPVVLPVTNRYENVVYLATRIKAILLTYITFTRRNLHTQTQKNILMGMYTALNQLVVALQKNSKGELTSLPIYINNIVAIVKSDLLTDLKTWVNGFVSGARIDEDDCIAYLRLRYMILAIVKLLTLASDGEDLKKLQQDISALKIPEVVNRVTKNATIKTIFFDEEMVNKNLAAIYPEDVEYRNKSETFLFGYIYENLMKIFILITDFPNVSKGCRSFYTSLNVLFDEFVIRVEDCINKAKDADTNVWLLSAGLFNSIQTMIIKFFTDTALNINYITKISETDFTQPFFMQPCFQDREVILKFLDQFAAFLKNLSEIKFVIADQMEASAFKKNITSQRLFYSTYRKEPVIMEMDNDLVMYMSKYKATLPKRSNERIVIERFINDTSITGLDEEHDNNLCGCCCCNIL